MLRYIEGKEIFSSKVFWEYWIFIGKRMRFNFYYIIYKNQFKWIEFFDVKFEDINIRKYKGEIQWNGFWEWFFRRGFKVQNKILISKIFAQ